MKNGLGETLTFRQVCELAGVDYDRYEGREEEPEPTPSTETVNTALLAACKAWQDWEAALIECDEAWRGGLPTIPQHLLDALTPLQEMRRIAIAQAEVAST